MSWLSEMFGKKPAATPTTPTVPPAPFKEGWPKRFTLQGVEFEIDKTQSEPLATLPDRVAKKAAKGIVKMWDEPVIGMPGHVRVYWIRPVVIKPPVVTPPA
jgi:hypothetical protein